MLHVKLKGQYASKMFERIHVPDLLVRVQISDIDD